ncbi:MAG: hypothetical protein HQL71_04415, partial [Magnetococcales bacterium]|nr:hypothetical protein [Magnetococcales bacterium]
MTKFRLLILSCLFCLISLLVAPQAWSKTFHYPTSGISITTPKGWVEIPATVTESITKSVGVSIPGLGGPRLRIGFQPNPSRGWLQPPYILFIISNSGRIAQSRIKPMETMDLSLTRDREAKSMSVKNGASIGQGHYEANNKLIWRRSNVPIGPNGGIKVLSGTLLTQVGFIKILGYSPIKNYGQNEDIFRKITASIELDDWLQYQEKETRNYFTRQSGSFWITIIAIIIAAIMTKWLGTGQQNSRKD